MLFCACLCRRCTTTTTWNFLIARFVEDVCRRHDFHIYQNLSEISMKRSIEWITSLTQVRFVYAFVTTPKFKMVAQISPWVAYNWWLFVNGTCTSTANFQREKRATFPKLHLFPGTFQWNALKTCVSLNIPTRISGISWLIESAQDNDFLFLNFDKFLWKNSPKFVELNEIE